MIRLRPCKYVVERNVADTVVFGYVAQCLSRHQQSRKVVRTVCPEGTGGVRGQPA